MVAEEVKMEAEVEGMQGKARLNIAHYMAAIF